MLDPFPTTTGSTKACHRFRGDAKRITIALDDVWADQHRQISICRLGDSRRNRDLQLQRRGDEVHHVADDDRTTYSGEFILDTGVTAGTGCAGLYLILVDPALVHLERPGKLTRGGSSFLIIGG